MNGIGEIGDDLAGLGAIAVQLRKLLERGAGIARQHGLEQIEDAGAVGEAQQPAHRVGLDLARAEGDGAVEDRERIAHRAFGGAGDERERRPARRTRLPAR